MRRERESEMEGWWRREGYPHLTPYLSEMTPLPQALTLLPSTLLMVLQMMKQKGLQEAWQEAVCVCLYVCVCVCVCVCV